MMPEKRPHSPNGSTQSNGTPKKARSNNGSPIPPPQSDKHKTIQDQIAAAKERAAAARDRITGGAKPASPAPALQGQTPAEAARAKIEAVRARVAAATAGSGGASQQQQQSVRPQSAAPSFQPPLEQDDGATRARGGLGIGLHPALMGDSVQDGRGQKNLMPKFGTTIGNRRPSSPGDQPLKKKQLDLSEPSLDEIKKDNPYFDASLGGASSAPRARKSRELLFNQKGKFIAQAAALRQQARLEDMKRRIAESARRAGLNEDRSEQAFLVKDVPDVEWWDEGLIADKEYPDLDDDPSGARGKLKIDTEDSVITSYIQHPVLLEAPQDRIPFQQKPMHLTKEEQKKMRRQTRMAELKEKQAKVRLGLEAPEAPKIKKSNLMRVLGEQAVKDPTAVEARVNREIAERRDKHEQDNTSRKLTKEQRHEKLAANMQKDAAKGLFVTVYRIDSLAYNKNRMKIDINAKEFHDLTGIMLTHPRTNIIIVEAGQHTTSFFKKLMLRRIRWDENAASTVNLDEGRGKESKQVPGWLRPENETGGLKDLSENRCVLVWEGEVRERSFKRWTERDCESDGMARQVLEKNKMENMWMLAKNWSD